VIKHITILGAGNVATHLTLGLHDAGFTITEIFSPSEEKSSLLAGKVKSKVCKRIEELSPNSDLYLLCIPDRFIGEVSMQIPRTNGIVAHTSGITPMNSIKRHKNIGVFYPLQTFSAKRDIALDKVPFCIEASSATICSELKQTALQLGSNVKEVDTGQRQLLHLAAVFVNNFVNFLYTSGAEILRKKNLPFDFLLPLIEETARKITEIEPYEAQTGPARRNDITTMEIHKKMLDENAELKDLYDKISNLIINKYNEQL
jgi:predicted short-subunit dehydrogenase-like oxidoreductase (DUF2520 family)